MKRPYLLILLLAILIVSCAKKSLFRFPKLPDKPIPSIPNELRGVWITRFNYAYPDADSMKNRIITIMQKTAAANFNTVFFQVRGQAETLYPSPLEPWSKLVGATDPGFDPVALAVHEAHKHGLTFYAYINLMPLWNDQNPPDDPNHLYFKHGPEGDPDSSWLCFQQNGKPMQLNEYYYLNPALPEVKSYLKKVIGHFVKNYNVDGLHFDRIRYPGPTYLYDPYSIQQFGMDSLRSPLTRADWARWKLTDLVEDVVAEALLIKPYLVISAATWGMYRTDDINGYEHFGSGYENYYQDAIDWLEKGIMDFIVPMIYWDIEQPVPNFHELWSDFKSRTLHFRYIFPGMRLRPGWITNGETASQVNFVRQSGGLGHVMFAYSDLEGKGLATVKKILYPDRAELPSNLKRVSPEQVFSLRLAKKPSALARWQYIKVEPFSQEETADREGWIGLILPRKPDSLKIQTDSGIRIISTSNWYTPYKYKIQTDGSVTRESPWVEMRRLPQDTVFSARYHLLCRTEYPGQAFINSDSVKLYRTGIFFKEIRLTEGENRIAARVVASDSSIALYEREFVYQKVAEGRDPFPLWIDVKTIQPDQNHILLPQDKVRMSFVGSKGQRAVVEIRPTKLKIPFYRKDFDDYSLYQVTLPLQLLKKRKRHQFKIVLEAITSQNKGSKLRLPMETTVEVWDMHDFPLVQTSKMNAIMRYNLGPIRLGGPIVAEYPTGIILKVSGQIGEHYRIYLNKNEEGFIHRDFVEELPEGHVKPAYYLRSISSRPEENADVVYIPYPEPVPYAVYPEPDQNRIRISLYGVKTSSTWMIHRKGLKFIKKVTWQQPTPETYQVIINLKSSKIWGYQCQPEKGSLVFRVKYPPSLIQEDSTQSLSGLKIAIEAGHGGRSTGAMGLSGLLEKDINLDLARKLADICRSSGMEVLQVREEDADMALARKRDTVETSDADLLVSIHANASGSGGGYLGVGGTSTYYHNPFWADFAEIVYHPLLDLELEEFGVVGSFNYIVTRMSSRPAILVEQAFMSHAEDEEKLASQEFRLQMAQKIFQGIVEYVAYMLDE